MTFMFGEPYFDVVSVWRNKIARRPPGIARQILVLREWTQS